MKIIQFIQRPQQRGAEIFACQLSNHLISFGHEVKIVTIFKGEGKLPFNGEIINLNLTPGKRFFDIAGWKKIASLIEEFQPDIIQANAGDTLKYVVFSKKIFRWKQPIVFRNASETGRYLKSSLQKRMNNFFYKNVDQVISVSKASEFDIIKNFPFLNGKTRVIPIGLEEKKLNKIKFNPVDSKHIVHVGGFSFEKNHEGLLRIFKRLLEKSGNAHLHLVGDGPLRKKIEVLVKELKLSKNVTFYGFVSNPLDYIYSADVLVLPSIIEGLPGVILEAMYCKTPVVAYNVGGVSEILNESTGNLIEKNDETSFVNSVLKSVKKPSEGQIQRAFELVLKDYMNEKISKKFTEAYTIN